jgi:hypothetical protein
VTSNEKADDEMTQSSNEKVKRAPLMSIKKQYLVSENYKFAESEPDPAHCLLFN